MTEFGDLMFTTRQCRETLSRFNACLGQAAGAPVCCCRFFGWGAATCICICAILH
jgi:hypothetical protein